ncbi:MAG: hypothetical protein CMH30_00700 [Micavibrio sp.]|nr:hypothetical protein [Micavibrio sp.]|tara:strand:+ start:3174 stop:4085 length:912 start_codon:yes stop_codon:yes gene_type:complete
MSVSKKLTVLTLGASAIATAAFAQVCGDPSTSAPCPPVVTPETPGIDIDNALSQQQQQQQKLTNKTTALGFANGGVSTSAPALSYNAQGLDPISACMLKTVSEQEDIFGTPIFNYTSGAHASTEVKNDAEKRALCVQNVEDSLVIDVAKTGFDAMAPEEKACAGGTILGGILAKKGINDVNLTGSCPQQGAQAEPEVVTETVYVYKDAPTYQPQAYSATPTVPTYAFNDTSACTITMVDGGVISGTVANDMVLGKVCTPDMKDFDRVQNGVEEVCAWPDDSNTVKYDLTTAGCTWLPKSKLGL